MVRLISKILVILIVLQLSACGLFAAPVSQQTPRPNDASTQAAHIVETEIARPSRTPTPPATQTPIPPSPTSAEGATLTALAASPTHTPGIRITALPGLELYVHPDIQDYVFQIDPAKWESDPQGSSDLVHQSIANCAVNSVSGSGLGPPERLFWQDLGRFRWEIMEYGTWAYAVPIQGTGVSDQGNSFLRLPGFNRAACRSDQEEILENLMLRGEAGGEYAFTPFSSPTPRPALQGFDCPNAPPTRRRVGDVVSVITNGLWFRSEPRADKSTEVRQFMRYPPVYIRVVGGPVCEKFVYWEVEVTTFGEAGVTTQGWLAEGDAEDYFLEPVK